ncbi:13328_t:CDS:2 [Funneliformis caledonium]|uniref:13328_t:CDS:1 n=1 Tax=Funneliformis caledonium TaxID=1117310 RepID=A0A9N9DVZ6_9GLOM|nr:13328_t:CDS:2 [Funneliformis caledonium]
MIKDGMRGARGSCVLENMRKDFVWWSSLRERRIRDDFGFRGRGLNMRVREEGLFPKGANVGNHPACHRYFNMKFVMAKDDALQETSKLFENRRINVKLEQIVVREHINYIDCNSKDNFIGGSVRFPAFY